MIQGTCSGAGKSTLVAGLCRVLARKGMKVAPFKPQNMSLNSAVAADGGEIARAQALQAQAARVPALVDMNPVLLKPSSDTRAQVVVAGKPVLEVEAGKYQDLKSTLLPEVLAAFHRLHEKFDAVIVEGAGSPAEVNLRANDIANMGFAEAADLPVLLVADIDRGGALAHVVGTLACLSASERGRIEGIVINRFRGSRALLTPGLEWLERECGKPVLGVLPHLNGLYLDAEDALPESKSAKSGTDHVFRVAVPVYPRISNHTDFDALRLHPQVELLWVGPGAPLPAADLVILPGSKNVRADLEFLQAQGWADAILRHLRYGGRVIGICGGMQMLGHVDPRSGTASKGRRDRAPASGCSTSKRRCKAKSSCAMSREWSWALLSRATKSTWALRTAPRSTAGPKLRFPPTTAFSRPTCTASSTRPRHAQRCCGGQVCRRRKGLILPHSAKPASSGSPTAWKPAWT